MAQSPMENVFPKNFQIHLTLLFLLPSGGLSRFSQWLVVLICSGPPSPLVEAPNFLPPGAPPGSGHEVARAFSGRALPAGKEDPP